MMDISTSMKSESLSNLSMLEKEMHLHLESLFQFKINSNQ